MNGAISVLELRVKGTSAAIAAARAVRTGAPARPYSRYARRLSRRPTRLTGARVSRKRWRIALENNASSMPPADRSNSSLTLEDGFVAARPVGGGRHDREIARASAAIDCDRDPVRVFSWLLAADLGNRRSPISRSESQPRRWRHGPACGCCRPANRDCVPSRCWRWPPIFFVSRLFPACRVARLAFDPNLPLHPGFVSYRLQLPEGGARCAFQALSSLLPGSLPTGTDADGALVVHCLDTREPVAANFASEEALFMRATGHD